MQLTFRPGNSSDHGFICSCILNGARKGHFAIDVSSHQAVHLFKRNMAAILRHENLVDDRRGEVFIFSRNGERIGLAIVTEVNNEPLSREIYALAVLPKFRGKGYGRQILDTLMRGLQQHVVYARCAPRSEIMHRMFLARNFHLLRETVDGFRLLKRDNIDLDDLLRSRSSYRFNTSPSSPAPETQAQTSEK